ncbi:MAG TPA: phytoene/squalene synthase family protein [Dermatophilaceae bacterium]|nr:phytoene/squalene synthase family protein [Dermatophilaceae bacterium]
MSVPAELAPAYRQCRRVMAAHGRTFYLATRLLGRDARPHVWALYAFARLADELVDDMAGADPIALQRFSVATMTALEADDAAPEGSVPPVLAAVRHTMRHYDLSPDLLAEFLASMAMDLTVTRYPTWADLRGYMRGSAAVIGELVNPILGGGAGSAAHAAALGEAFQLTNFLRDVAEDWQRGRVYLPQADLARFGVADADMAEAVLAGRPSRALRELVRFEVERNLGLYAQARPGLAMLSRRGRLCVAVAFTLYRMVLREIVAADYDVFSRRHVVPTAARARTTARLLLRRHRIGAASGPIRCLRSNKR